MPKSARKIVNVVLTVLLIAVLAGIAYWVIVVGNDPWWLAAAIDCGVVGMLLAITAARRYFLRRKERKFIDRIVDQDNARIPAGEMTRHQLLEQQEHWKESVLRLQKSRLRKKGNPLYALPWYMVIGESGTGKTSAIEKSGLSTPMTEVASVRGIGGTRNCDWYFFDNGIILDTAGRYTIPIDEGPDFDEWKNFLALLARYRRKEPLNGVIVAISAESLLTDGDEKIVRNGKLIRQRINHTMRAVGAKFPVYVLVTKMDRVYGFDDFNRKLNPGSLDQAMGFINERKRIYWRDVFDDAVSSISEKLALLRTLLARQSGVATPMLVFPTEFSFLSTRLHGFLESVFAENSYQETPLLRGIFFSSALRQGQPISELLRVTGLQVDDLKEDPLPPNGIYLKEFFARILPGDRKVYVPLAEFNLWKRLTSSFALSSWLLLSVLLLGVAGYSYVYSYTAIADYRQVFPKPPIPTGNTQDDLLIMERYRQEILTLEKKNRSWFLPSMGFEQRIRLEKTAKQHYCDLFEKRFVATFDKALRQRLDGRRNDLVLDRQQQADLFGYLVLRTIALQTRQDDAGSFGKIDFIPMAAQLLRLIYPDLDDEIAGLFGSMYYSYVSWDIDKPSEKVEAELLRQLLVNQLASPKAASLEWLTELRHLGAHDQRLSTLWNEKPEGNGGDDVILKGAFTREGRERIEGFIDLLGKALAGSNDLAAVTVADPAYRDQVSRFRGRYRNEFFDAWHNFIEKVPTGTSLLRTDEDWREGAIAMAGMQNPYITALDVAAKEIASFESHGFRPSWAVSILHVARLRQLARELEESKQGGVKGLVAGGEMKATSLFDSAKGGRHSAAFADTLKQSKAWEAYAGSIVAIPAASMSAKQFADAYAGCFSYQSPAGQQGSAFQKMYEAAVALNNTLRLRGTLEDPDPVARLLLGPLEFLLLYARDQTSDYLQQQWNETVLGSLPQDRTKLARQLFGQGGTVLKFVSGPALPFISNGPAGYEGRVDFMGNQLSFEPVFLEFLDRGSLLPQEIQPSYRVILGTLPVRANAGARLFPVSVRLEVSCADKPFTLNNFNYPQQAGIDWSPDSCGSTTLTIVFPEFTLKKTYPGNMGFARFLHDFRSGNRVFLAGEFPEQAPFLRRYEIASVSVSYRISGAEAVLKLLEEMPETVPSTIFSQSGD